MMAGKRDGSGAFDARAWLGRAVHNSKTDAAELDRLNEDLKRAQDTTVSRAMAFDTIQRLEKEKADRIAKIEGKIKDLEARGRSICGLYADGDSVYAADGYRLHIARYTSADERRAAGYPDGLIKVENGLTPSGRFPDAPAVVGHVINDRSRVVVVDRPDELLRIVKLADVFTTNQNAREASVRLAIEDDRLIVSASDQTGDCASFIPVVGNGTRSAWIMRVHYLRDLLGAFGKDRARLFIPERVGSGIGFECEKAGVTLVGFIMPAGESSSPEYAAARDFESPAALIGLTWLPPEKRCKPTKEKMNHRDWRAFPSAPGGAFIPAAIFIAPDAPDMGPGFKRADDADLYISAAVGRAGLSIPDGFQWPKPLRELADKVCKPNSFDNRLPSPAYMASLDAALCAHLVGADRPYFAAELDQNGRAVYWERDLQDWSMRGAPIVAVRYVDRGAGLGFGASVRDSLGREWHGLSMIETDMMGISPSRDHDRFKGRAVGEWVSLVDDAPALVGPETVDAAPADFGDSFLMRVDWRARFYAAGVVAARLRDSVDDAQRDYAEARGNPDARARAGRRVRSLNARQSRVARYLDRVAGRADLHPIKRALWDEYDRGVNAFYSPAPAPVVVVDDDAQDSAPAESFSERMAREHGAIVRVRLVGDRHAWGGQSAECEYADGHIEALAGVFWQAAGIIELLRPIADQPGEWHAVGVAPAVVEAAPARARVRRPGRSVRAVRLLVINRRGRPAFSHDAYGRLIARDDGARSAWSVVRGRARGRAARLYARILRARAVVAGQSAMVAPAASGPVSLIIPARSGAPARPGRRIVWRLVGAERGRIVARGRAGRRALRPVPASPAQPAQPINAPTFDDLINGLTFDDLARMMGDRIARVALEKVQTRMREIGREMRAAERVILSEINAARPPAVVAQPINAPTLVGPAETDYLPCVNEPEAVEAAPALVGPDWSVWGGFWDNPPAPDLEDTQPMAPIGPDDDDQPEPPAPSGGGSDSSVAPALVVALRAGRVVVVRGRDQRAGLLHWSVGSVYTWSDAARLILGRNRHGLIFAGEWLDAVGGRVWSIGAGVMARGKRNGLRLIRVQTGRSEDAIVLDDDVRPAEPYRSFILKRRGRINRPTLAEPINADTFTENVAHETEAPTVINADTLASINAPTFDAIITEAIGHEAMGQLSRSAAVHRARSAKTSDGARDEVIKLEAYAAQEERAYNAALAQLPGDLADAVRAHREAYHAFSEAGRAVHAWADHIGKGLALVRWGSETAPDAATFPHDYGMMAREIVNLVPLVEIAEAAYRDVISLGVSEETIDRPTEVFAALCALLREARLEINKTLHIHLRADKAEKLA